MTETPISFKLYLYRSKETDIRRFRGAFDWDAFTTSVAHFWNGGAPRSILVEYDDDEGDRIRVTNAAEWDECLRLYVSRGVEEPLKLHLRRHKKDMKLPAHGEPNSTGTPEHKAKSPKSPPTPTGGDAVYVSDFELEGQDERPRTAAAAAATTDLPPVPRLNLAAEAATGTDGTASPMRTGSGAAAGDQSARSNAALQLLTMIFGYNAVDHLMAPGSGAVAEGLAECLTATPVDGCDEIHVDVHLRKIEAHAALKATVLLDSGDVGNAEALLRECIDVCGPSIDAAIALAAVYTQSGRVHEALTQLENAVACGCAPRAIRANPRFTPLRSDPSFAEKFGERSETPLPNTSHSSFEFVPSPHREEATPVDGEAPVEAPADAGEEPCPRGIAPEEATSAATLSTAATEPVEPAQPAQPAQPADAAQPAAAPSGLGSLFGSVAAAFQPRASGFEAYPREVEQLQAIFPHIGRDEASRRMNEARGDIRVAINRLLTQA